MESSRQLLEYSDAIKNLNPEIQVAIESHDGPSVEQMRSPKISAVRKMWLNLPHEVRLRIAFSATEPQNQNAA